MGHNESNTSAHDLLRVLEERDDAEEREKAELTKTHKCFQCVYATWHSSEKVFCGYGVGCVK